MPAADAAPRSRAAHRGLRSRAFGFDRFSNPIPAIKRNRQPQTFVARGRAAEESTNDFNV